MMKQVNCEGVKAIVRNSNFKIYTIAFLAVAAFTLNACTNSGSSNSVVGSNVDANETAATVNGKAIKLEEVERAIKQQGQGQESKLSPLELAQARLQVLEGLIQQEVMFQKAEKEGTVPKDEDVTVEFNKKKTESGLSAEAFDKKMQEIGETDASAREKIKRGLAVQRLIDKITGKIEPPKDKEIDDFYAGNKEAFIKKRGVKLAAIVVDPTDSGEGDATKNDVDAIRVAQEIANQVRQNPASFAQVASEKSEDQQSRLQGGDLGYISEDQLKQTFPPQVAAALMDPKFAVGQIAGTQAQGKYYILKLQERSDKDENLTLDSPGIRQQVTDSLVNARKQLLAASYQSLAMDEAKIENYLAKKVVDNPNDLSGARPASTDTPTNMNTNANANVNTNANVNANVNANAKTNVAAKPPVKPTPAAKTNANVK